MEKTYGGQGIACDCGKSDTGFCDTSCSDTQVVAGEKDVPCKEWCGENHCDTNGCNNRVRQWVTPPMQETGRSLEECKDEIAKDYGYRNWSSLASLREDIVLMVTDEVAELYASKRQLGYTKEDLIKAYEYGQSDCGEFGMVMGFDDWFNEYTKDR